MVSMTGGRKAQASRESFGDVRSPPVTAIAPARWMVQICFMTFVEPLLLGPVYTLSDGVHHRSTAYNILGIATPMNNRLAYLGVTPQHHDGLAILLICAAHLVPFSMVYAYCAFQFRF